MHRIVLLKRLDLRGVNLARADLKLKPSEFLFIRAGSTVGIPVAMYIFGFMIAVGSSSRDLVATEAITLDAPRLSLPLGPDSTLHEWLEDERGRELLSKRDVRLLQDPELIKVIGTMPMHTLAAFQGMALSHDELEDLVAGL
jgi:hypothetical protein